MKDIKNITYISAGAGSGKTYKLTNILADLISKDKDDPEHIEPEQVILTTFTVKAAGEFRERAKSELYKRGKYDEASRLDNALIGTMHSVASALIRKYWYAIGLSPKQGVMDDNAKDVYVNQSIANIPKDEDLRLFAKFRKVFNVVSKSKSFKLSKPDENFWKGHLKSIIEESISFDIADYSKSEEESLKILKELCDGSDFSMDYKSRDKVLNDLRSLVVEGCRESPTKTNTLKAIENLRKNGDSKEDIEWIIDFGNIMSKAPAIRGTADSVDEAKQKATDIWRSQKVYDLQEEYIKTIFRLAKEWNEQYAEYKRNKHIMDYCDMEHYMHKLLQDKEVAAEIGRTYTHLFVDEFQDCSPIQVKIFMALAKVVKKSYWVGDNKQAIYGFRGSDTQLTKAVADAIGRKEGKDGCHTETLEKNWRSVPALVEANNEVFVKIFSPVFGEETKKQVSLKSAMETDPKEFKVKLEDRAKNPLRYLDVKGKSSPMAKKLNVADLAQYIKNVIEEEKVNPSDIAVLGKTNADLGDVQAALKEIGIDCDRETDLNKDSKACQLMMALTTLTVNPQDDLAKASIAYLTEDNMDAGKIIDSKLEYNDTPKEERKPWLGETEMVKRVDALRPLVMYQGIGALMETLAVELDVKNIMERWDMPIEQCMTDVKTLIAAAKQYEERSSELAQPATPSGFAAFLSENKVKLPVGGNGVQLLTYHGSKGLEWKYVFVLMDETLDAQEILSREFYGVHHFHPEQPSADNLYPEMSIRLLPWIFGSKTNVPGSIGQPLFASERYATLEKHCKEEKARLLYVGMTRAAEVLVIVPWFAKNELDWFRHLGLNADKTNDNGDVLGIEVNFEIVEAQYPQEEEDNAAAEPGPKQCRMLDYHSDTPSDAEWLTVAPSGVEGKADKVDVVYRSEEYIKINNLHGHEYSEVGDCIHDVFAAIEHLEQQEVEQLIRSHDMGEVIPNAGEVIRAWNNLQGFLKKNYGEPTAVYHERPFRQLQENGTMVVGSIDYVYRTQEGSILIDFKTFPQVQAVTDPTSKHYAGNYAGQLNAYATALEGAGEKVVKRLIYYPVSGIVCEIGKVLLA